jgi:hypothetical protein
MPRRSKRDIESLRSVGNETCPHCDATLSPAEYLRVDSERLRCARCGKGFHPGGERRPADAAELRAGKLSASLDQSQRSVEVGPYFPACHSFNH